MNQQASAVFAPSDHLILNDDQYAQTVNKALKIVQKKDLVVTLGIMPTRPDTAYGYIQILEDKKEEDGYFKVKTFEKSRHSKLQNRFSKAGTFYGTPVFLSPTSER